MAGRTARKPPEDNGGELKKMDFEGALRTYREDIKGAVSRAGAEMKDAGDGYKHIKKNCHIPRGAAKQAFAILEMEDAAAQIHMRAVNGILRAAGCTLEPDLVDAAEGRAGDQDMMPSGTPKPRPNLVAVKPGDDEDFDGGPPRKPPVEEDA